jgi:hypothetical protein
MGFILILLFIAAIIIIYKNYNRWYYAYYERKKSKIEYQDLEFDLQERKSYLRLQITEMEMKWRYHLQFLEVVKEKNATFNMYEVRQKKLEVLKQLNEIEILKLNGLNSALAQQKTEELLQQSSEKLQKMYDQINQVDEDEVT